MSDGIVLKPDDPGTRVREFLEEDTVLGAVEFTATAYGFERFE